jgi:hypothetical protein
MNEKTTFARLAAQCAMISSSDSIVFENQAAENPIRFQQMNEKKMNEVRRQMMDF